jgi:hypothetical protein
MRKLTLFQIGVTVAFVAALAYYVPTGTFIAMLVLCVVTQLIIYDMM